MRTITKIGAMLAGLAAMSAAGVAAAHPSLVSASPAANAPASNVTRILLRFNERLTPRLSGATLTMTGMPGMANHPDMPMTDVSSALSSDRTALVITSPRPLPAGSYRVNWHVVGADTHRITGTHEFTVR
ncbi:MAG: copper homeostasis periplasmic binding protein CopC [Allosphingosinicella sp.]|uniref:copper homeostasis periplasmic binding protein CopC n=1 Tax=Allosphingosinicella sp. TaxID=2823234 RepID=UPI00394485BC